MTAAKRPPDDFSIIKTRREQDVYFPERSCFLVGLAAVVFKNLKQCCPEI
jgi:hypothetical protein